MRGKCDRGIAGIVWGSGLTGALTSSSRIDDGETVRSTRGLRGGRSADAGSGTDGLLTGGAGVASGLPFSFQGGFPRCLLGEFRIAGRLLGFQRGLASGTSAACAAARAAA